MKCYVCKFVNAVGEAHRHFNPTTVVTAKLLKQRWENHRKGNPPYKLCVIHRDDLSQRSKDLSIAGVRLFKLTTPKKKEEK